MSNLLDTLIKTPPRETSGSTTSNRYDFQKNWAICKLLELHSSGADYLLVLEFHEDILVLDSESSPQTISFYQVKSKRIGTWSCSELIRCQKGKKSSQSYLALLCGNWTKFPTATNSLNFVSNAPYKFGLADPERSSINETTIVLNQLANDDRRKITEALAKQLGSAPVVDHLTFFIVTDLSLDATDSHAKGKLAEFLEAAFPKGKFRVSSVHEALFGEVRRKTNAVPSSLTVADFVSTKAIGRSTFDQMLSGFDAGIDFDEKWRQIEVRLNSEGYPYHELSDIADHWKACEIDRLGGAETPNIRFLRDQVQLALATAKMTGRLTDTLDSAYGSCLAAGKSTILDHPKAYLKAMILMEYHAKGNLSEASPQPQETDL